MKCKQPLPHRTSFQKWKNNKQKTCLPGEFGCIRENIFFFIFILSIIAQKIFYCVKIFQGSSTTKTSNVSEHNKITT